MHAPINWCVPKSSNRIEKDLLEELEAIKADLVENEERLASERARFEKERERRTSPGTQPVPLVFVCNRLRWWVFALAEDARKNHASDARVSSRVAAKMLEEQERAQRMAVSLLLVMLSYSVPEVIRCLRPQEQQRLAVDASLARERARVATIFAEKFTPQLPISLVPAQVQNAKDESHAGEHTVVVAPL
eukprot:SAG31_NODE_6714_length_1914_cov_1.576860_2_plen_190_part_00